MKENKIIDRNRNEIKQGDFIFIHSAHFPMGNVYSEKEIEESHEVVFKYGTLGIESSINFEPLFNMMFLENGEYNHELSRSKTIYTEKYSFWKDESK